jgi:spermidine/putrescine transport system permease protein
MLKRLSTAPYLLWSFLLIVVPLVMVLGYSLIRTGVRGPEFSLDGFIKFTDPLYLKVLGLSIWIALQSTVLCLLIGYPLAMIMAGLSPSAQRTAMTMIILPMWMNFLLRTYAWIPILGRNGLLNGLLATIGIPPLNLLFNEGAVLLGMVYNFLPFMVLPIFTVLIRMDRSVIEAAQDLGANRLNVFWRVTLPCRCRVWCPVS